MSEETKNSQLETAIAALVLWKLKQIEKVCALICTIGIVKHNQGTYRFAADDIPEAMMPPKEDVNTVGAAWKLLQRAKIVSPLLGCVAEEIGGKQYQVRRPSRHKSAHGRQIGVWVIAPSLAKAWLERNGQPQPVVATVPEKDFFDEVTK